MAQLPGIHATRIYSAAARWRAQALVADRGVLPGPPVWTEDILTALHRRLAGRAQIRGQTFMRRWYGVLEAADDLVLRAGAELLWLHLLFPDDVSGERKRQAVGDTLALMVHPVDLPDDLDQPLSRGLARSGIAYKARRLSQLQMLTEATLVLKRSSRRGRERLLADPWACRAWLTAVPTPGTATQREVLLHLLHPATFEPIASTAMKQQIVEAFADLVPEGVDDVDRALLHVRSGLEAQHGAGFAFASPELAARWRQDSTDD